MNSGHCGIIYIGNLSDCPENDTSSHQTDTHSSQAFEVVLELYVMSLLCLIGLFGNVMCVVVLRRDKQRRETSFLLQALAIADGLYIICALLRYPLKHLIPDKADYVVMQPYVFPLLKTCQTLTIWMMVLVTVDRFMHVCHPLQTPEILRRRGTAVVIVYIAAIIYNLPRFFDSCIMRWVDVCANTTTTRMVYSTTFNKVLYFDIYKYLMYIIFLYVLPLATLLVLNIKLIQAIRISKRRVQSAHSSASYENNATLVLVIIILVFIICETPELLLKIATVVSRHLQSTGIFNTHLIRFGIINEVLMVINSSSNFIIYVLFGKRFRHIMKETFRSLAHTNSSTYTPETPHHIIPLNFARH